jgi:hypothetical protein
MTINRIGAEYLLRLQGIYHQISNRGILVDMQRIEEAKDFVDKEIETSLQVIRDKWKCHVYIGAANDDGTKDSVNLNASSGSRTPLLKLQSLGYKIPKIQKRNEDTGEYESKESLAELALQRMLSSNQFNIPGGDPVITNLLKIRELGTLRSRYINARLYDRTSGRYFLSNYNVAGTTTGRRSSRKHTFGFGNNAQNFPSHGAMAPIFKRCLVTRPGRLFLTVDQIQAEDWPVSALAHNAAALAELESGIDRHLKLASMIFNLPPEKITDNQRYLGKKTRHARNYGMRGNTMSDSLAEEGFPGYPPGVCQFLLDTAGKIDPSVEGVFHKYVQEQLYATRTLRTPFGRERQFFGLRTGDNAGNQKIFREAYSFIPQSTVGDNTGFAVYYLESPGSGCVVQEGHDSVVQEIEDTLGDLWIHIAETVAAFDRRITFHNGISLQIPIEAKIGYDFGKLIEIHHGKSKRLVDCTFDDVKDAYEKLRELRNESTKSESKLTAAEETVSELGN